MENKKLRKNIWYSLENRLPPVNKLVGLKHEIIGIGAPEREGWESTGRMRGNKRFSIRQNIENSVDFRKPTHFKILS